MTQKDARQEYISLNEFFGVSAEDQPMAIHCDTPEKARTLLKLFASHGERWAGGQSYLDPEEVNWETHEETTCYSNGNKYGSQRWYKKNGYQIYEYERVLDVPENSMFIFLDYKKG